MQRRNLPKKTSAEARAQRIRSLLAENTTVSISALAPELGVSEMTIRRDLTLLSQNERVRRTHGGVVLAERSVFEFENLARQREREVEKQAIARLALPLIEPGQCILLDTGTTTWHLARLLKGFEKLTVITPSLAVASELQFAKNVKVILLGGVLHAGSADLTGPVTEHCLDLFSADWAFQGTEGLGTDGDLYNVDLQLAQVDRKMRGLATRSCLLADSTKIGRTALVRSGHLSDLDVFITDTNAPRNYLAMARQQVANVLVAKL